jgi:hypothetical protein
VDTGNGFGTRVFWTAVIPDSDLQINPGAGTAALHVRNLAEVNYYSPTGGAGTASLGPNWQTVAIDSTVSFDVVWGGPVTRRVNVTDSTYDFAGTFNEVNNNNVTVTWSGSNALGFRFTSDVGNLATSTALAPGNFFAQLAKERNGIFFPGGGAALGAAAPPSAQQQQPVLAAAGASDAQVAALDQVQAIFAVLPGSYSGAKPGGEIRISPSAGGWGWSTDASHPAVTAPASNGNQAVSVPASFAVGSAAVAGASSQVSATALPLAPSVQTSATDLIDVVLAGLDGGTLMRALGGDKVTG